LNTEIYDLSQKWSIINSVAGLYNPEYIIDELGQKIASKFSGKPHAKLCINTCMTANKE